MCYTEYNCYFKTAVVIKWEEKPTQSQRRSGRHHAYSSQLWSHTPGPRGPVHTTLLVHGALRPSPS